MPCLLFLPLRIGARRRAPMVLRMSCSSPTCSATPTSASTSWRIWGFFIAAWCADPNCPGASTLIVPTVCDGHVGGSHLLPPQSGVVHGFEQSDHSFTEVMFLTYGVVASTAPLLPGAVTTWLTDAHLLTSGLWRAQRHEWRVTKGTLHIIRGTVHATHTAETWNYCTTFWRSSQGCNFCKRHTLIVQETQNRFGCSKFPRA